MSASFSPELPCAPDTAAFVADVTVPDGTVFKPNEKFNGSTLLRAEPDSVIQR